MPAISDAALQDAVYASAYDVIPITPSTVEFAEGPCRALLVGVGGTINVVTAAGILRTGVVVPAGIVPIRARGVQAGGTATGLWALY
jgi:hypothetical protein